jgi:Rrf2 family protein
MLTRKTTYGIRALARMARVRPQSLSVAELAEFEGIPPKFLAVILSDLRQRGIVRGRRGRVGGYQLAVDPEALSIAEVVESLGGPLFPFVCLAREPLAERCRECPGSLVCPAQNALSSASNAAYAALRSLFLADLLCTEDELEPQFQQNPGIRQLPFSAVPESGEIARGDEPRRHRE